jgi:RHS repeat-associated protein
VNKKRTYQKLGSKNAKKDGMFFWQQYDESGKTETVTFDFKGNLLSKKQYVISSAELKAALDNYNTYLVDWTGLPSILGTQIFETSSEFDALNRATKITLPENVENDRKEIVPTYNRAGALQKVHYDNTEYVENIAYNAKGQRLLIAFGNDVMTRYVYDNRTFRLQRQKSEKYDKSIVGTTITYTPDSGSNKQDNAFNYDLIGNILKILNRVTDCGIHGVGLGSDALDRVFTYDPLYRLTSATGRESDTQEQNDYLYSNAPIPGSPNASNVRAYKLKYHYDKLGNILQMQQSEGNNFTRNFNYSSSNNKLADVKTGSSSLIQDFTYDAAGNQLTAGNNRHYQWNAANMMICYKNQTGSSNPTIFAQYDYAGQNRVSKMIRTGTDVSPIYERTIYIDGIFEYHILENGTTYEKNYVHVMDDTSRIAMVRIGDQFPDDIAESITYNLEDQVGSSTVRLSSIGSVIDKQEYYPFGDSSLRTFTKKRYQYTDKEKDAESGLYYYGARYYAAWTCRFISVDPLMAKYAHLSSYNYASNSPVTHLDIDGMQNPDEGTTPEGGGVQTTPTDDVNNTLPVNNQPAVDINTDNVDSVLMRKATIPMEGSELNYDEHIQKEWGKIDPLISKNDFVGWKDSRVPDKYNCNALSRYQMKLSGNTPSGSDEKIQTVVQSAITVNHDLTVTDQASYGVFKIQQELANGNPVMVGVNTTYDDGDRQIHKYDPSLNEGTTDHFIVIVGQ